MLFFQLLPHGTGLLLREVDLRPSMRISGNKGEYWGITPSATFGIVVLEKQALNRFEGQEKIR